MTLHRPAGSWEAALVATLHDLSTAEIEAATGKTRDLFEKLSRGTNRMGLHFADAAKLDAALKARGLPPRFLPLFLALSGGERGQPTVDLERALRRVGCEVGDLFRAAEESNADGVLTAEERRRVAKEAQEVIDQATVIRDALEPPTNGAAPALRVATGRAGQ